MLAHESVAGRLPRPIQVDKVRSVAWGAAVTAICTLVNVALNAWVEHTELVMVYMLGIVLVAGRRGRLAAVTASILSVANFNFWFVPPFHTFAVADLSYLLTFAVMLLVGLTISGLSEQVRRRADEAHAARLEAEKESLRSAMLSSVSHDLRTPLATIFGAASTLRDDAARLSSNDRARLADGQCGPCRHPSTVAVGGVGSRVCSTNPLPSHLHGPAALEARPGPRTPAPVRHGARNWIPDSRRVTALMFLPAQEFARC